MLVEGVYIYGEYISAVIVSGTDIAIAQFRAGESIILDYCDPERNLLQWHRCSCSLNISLSPSNNLHLCDTRPTSGRGNQFDIQIDISDAASLREGSNCKTTSNEVSKFCLFGFPFHFHFFFFSFSIEVERPFG